MRSFFGLVAAVVALGLVFCTSEEPVTNRGDDAGVDAASDHGTLTPTSLPSSFGSYVVLGDSISDQGGGPETQPIYRDLLYQNDDHLYPAWKGLTLKDKFGVQQYVPKAVGGSTTGALLSQLEKVPADLPTPILVTVTSGGNDLNSVVAAINEDPDASAPAAEKMASNVDQFLQAILAKYPAGEVFVLETDIYDPSGDTGRFPGCARIPTLDPKVDHDLFVEWNGGLLTSIGKHPPTVLAPLHDTFFGHDLNSADTWFYTDCIHPTKTGQHQTRRMFWKLLTGEDGPP